MPTFAAESAQIQPSLALDGGGRMVVNSQTNPDSETWAWEACTVDLQTCTPFAQGRIVETDGAPVPAVFRATSNYGATALSPQWNGAVTSASPPTVAGDVRANELVIPVPGQWLGGWVGDFDLTQLAACVFPNGTGCTPFTDPKFPSKCENGSAVLDPVFTGRYLRIADARLGSGGISTLEAVNPLTQRTWEASPTTAVAVVGRIKPARGPRKEACGMPPLIEASISSGGKATVLCRIGCRPTLVARQGRRTARVSRKLPSPYGSAAPRSPKESTLRLRTKQLRRFEPGRITYVVEVNGSPVARRTTSIC